jgi:hypothetical protein
VFRVQFEADRPDRDDAPIAGRVELAAQIADLHVDDEIARLEQTSSIPSSVLTP